MVENERSRKLSASRLSPQPRTSPHDSTDGHSGEEDGEKEERRGSVIEKVAHRAKFALPLRRNKENGLLERPDSPAGKSSQSSRRHDLAGQIRKLSTGHSHEEKTGLNSPLALTITANRSKKSLAPFAPRADNGLSSAGASERLRNSTAPTDNVSPLRVTTPAIVSPRRVVNGAPENGQDTQISRPSVVKRSNKIIDLATTDLNHPDPALESTLKTSQLKSPNAATRRQPSMNSIKEGVESTSSDLRATSPNQSSGGASSVASSSAGPSTSSDKPTALRSISAMKITSISSTPVVSSTTTPKVTTTVQSQRERKPPTFEPPMPEVEDQPDVQPAPAGGMYWSRAPCFGYDHGALRAHTATMVGSSIYVFGGCDSQACFNDLYILDTDCMSWTRPHCTGQIPPALRAMTATAVGKKIVIFGGGDGPAYYNDVYVFDTVRRRYTKPIIKGESPCVRRAHTACLYKHGIYVFGGGDGDRALNDIWRLDVTDTMRPFWKLISPSSGNPSSTSTTNTTAGAGAAASSSTGSASAPASSTAKMTKPTARGYHTANMVGSKLIIFGGSDGVECFRDVWVFDVETSLWRAVKIDVSYPRLSHTSTIIGSYMFVIGGHDGVEYKSDVLLLNLVTMQWDKRKVYGSGPSGRGYHSTVLHDSRVFVIGGFDG